MGFRNIKIDSHVKLSIKNQQLYIETDILRQIPLEDINCIIIENQTVTVSAYLLQKMADMGITVYVCDEKHLPNAVLLPMVRHSRHFKISDRGRKTLTEKTLAADRGSKDQKPGIVFSLS